MFPISSFRILFSNVPCRNFLYFVCVVSLCCGVTHASNNAEQLSEEFLLKSAKVIEAVPNVLRRAHSSTSIGLPEGKYDFYCSIYVFEILYFIMLCICLKSIKCEKINFHYIRGLQLSKGTYSRVVLKFKYPSFSLIVQVIGTCLVENINIVCAISIRCCYF